MGDARESSNVITTLKAFANSSPGLRFDNPGETHPGLQSKPVPELANAFRVPKALEDHLAMDIKESDWKVFRKLREPALERYCRRVLEEVRLTVDKDNSSYHERYLKLWKLLRNRDETIAIAFNDPKRSQAIIQLLNIVAEGLLTDAELNQFSEETREKIEGITRRRNL